jgi:hypothetical protein
MNSPLWVFINFQTPIIEQDSLQERVNRTTPFKPYDEKLYVPYRVLERSEINILILIQMGTQSGSEQNLMIIL